MDILRKYADINGFDYNDLLTDFINSSKEEQDDFLMQVGGESSGEIEQILSAYSQVSGIPVEQLVQELSQLPEDQQQQMLQQMVAQLEQSQGQPQMTQEGFQRGGIPLNSNGYYELDPIEDPYVQVNSEGWREISQNEPVFVPTKTGLSMQGISKPGRVALTNGIYKMEPNRQYDTGGDNLPLEFPDNYFKEEDDVSYILEHNDIDNRFINSLRFKGYDVEIL